MQMLTATSPQHPQEAHTTATSQDWTLTCLAMSREQLSIWLCIGPATPTLGQLCLQVLQCSL